MCRLLGWVAREPATAGDVLGEESLTAFLGLARYHADGWGAALDGTRGPEIQKSTLRGDTDPAFAQLLTSAATRAGVVHIRWATPGLPIDVRNTHPFSYGDTVFAHNGAIYPVEHLDALLSEPWSSRLTGTTDSEKYFLAVMAELQAVDSDLPAAIGRVVGRLTRDYRPSSLNALLETPTALLAINDHDPEAAPGSSPATSPAGATVDPTTHFDLRHRATDEAVVVASSGFVPVGDDGWELLPNHTVLVVDKATLTTEILPLG